MVMIQLLKKIRTRVLVWLTHEVALPALRHTRRGIRFHWSELDLYQLPEGTLGHDLYLFLEQRNLPLLTHYARHDLKHVLLGYDTTDEGEVCLQSFMLGNGRISFPVLATVAYGILTMPEYWGRMRRAFRQGRGCRSFHHWEWNEKVKEPTRYLRTLLFRQS